MTHTLSVTALLSVLLVTPVLAEDAPAPVPVPDPVATPTPAVAKTVADLHKERAALSGKQVTIHGKVVKVNNQIMDRNWVHLRDGTGDSADGSNDLTVTSTDTADLGDDVTVTGTVAADQDFGSGYKYPLLVEKATIAKAK